MTPLVWPHLTALAVGVTFAWLRGGCPERQAAAVWLLNAGMTWLLRDQNIDGFPTDTAFVDFLSMAALIKLALLHDRWWLLGAAATTSLWAVLHVGALVISPLAPLATPGAQLGLATLGLLCLASGALERRLAGERPVSAASWPAVGRAG